MTPDLRKPQNAIGLVRLSELRTPDLNDDGDAKGNVDQKDRIYDRARQLGWRVTRIIVENDLVSTDGKVRGVSAFKRRKILLPNGRVELRTVRPGFVSALTCWPVASTTASSHWTLTGHSATRAILRTRSM